MANAVEKIREFRAEAKFQRTSPQKAKLVLDLIKGLRVEHLKHVGWQLYRVESYVRCGHAQEVIPFPRRTAWSPSWRC